MIVQKLISSRERLVGPYVVVKLAWDARDAPPASVMSFAADAERDANPASAKPG